MAATIYYSTGCVSCTHIINNLLDRFAQRLYDFLDAFVTRLDFQDLVGIVKSGLIVLCDRIVVEHQVAIGLLQTGVVGGIVLRASVNLRDRTNDTLNQITNIIIAYEMEPRMR